MTVFSLLRKTPWRFFLEVEKQNLLWKLSKYVDILKKKDVLYIYHALIGVETLMVFK